MPKFVSVYNLSKNNLVASSVKIANNLISRSIGLLSRSYLSDDEGILIVPCKSIHSFFMRFEFDAIFIDNDNNVIEIVEKMKAFKFSKFIFKSKKILELASGSVEHKNIQIGDKLKIE